MKNLISICLLLFTFTTFAFGQDYRVVYDDQNQTLTFSISNYQLSPVNLSGKDFIKILFDGSVSTNEKGFAELPFLHATLQIEATQTIKVSTVEEKFEDHSLNFPLVPSRGVIYRDQDPSTIPFEIAPESLTNNFYPKNITELTEPFIIKDVRGITVYVYPFRYNAATQSLRVFTKLTLKIEDENAAPMNPLIKTSGKTFREMEGIYKSLFLNYKNDLDDLTVGEAGDILVITTARDEAAIQPYIDWKREKGYEVFKEVVATGTNVKSLIQQKYNENPEILYVQLVGDWADIKSDAGAGANAPTDPMLGCVAGSDYFPEIAIGRLSASSANQVTVQVNKIINYEKNPDGNWYSEAIGIASNQGPGDDGELDYQQVQVIYDNKLNPFTYNNHHTAYDPNGTATMVKNYINAGAGIINYCGHGSMVSWGSTGFSNTNVNQLTNGNMLPIIFSVACINGAFHLGECFAEAWLKKENGGAVMTLMATINQPWNPPMRGQDYFNDLLTGGYNYSANPGNGTNTTEGRSTIGAIVANGLALMYSESGGTEDLNTIKTWTIFGDPSMQVRTAAPAEITLSSTALTSGSAFTTTISSTGQVIEGALVCLSQDGQYASSYTDASGSVTIQNNFQPGLVKLVVTAFNTETIEMTLVNETATGFVPVWDTPFNPMNIYITEAILNGTNLEAGAQIGVFDIDPDSGEEICVGAATLSGAVSQSDYLEVIASMNDGTNPDQANGFFPGHNFIFKYINTNNVLIEDVNFTFPYSGFDEVFTAQGSAIINLSASTLIPAQQSVTLDGGWNAVSSGLIPQSSEITTIFNNVMGQLEFIQNLNQYYQPGNNENTLQSWDYKAGYFVKMNQGTEIIIDGYKPTDKTISLQPGWNLISILSSNETDIASLFTGQTDKLEIIKEALGTGVFWPAKNISTLSNFKPGKAYLVKVSEAFSISFKQ